MYKFAKVFESNGRQVLIMKGKTDVDGVETPRLSIIVHFDNGKQLDAGMVLQGGTFEDLDGIFELTGQGECDAVTKFITPGMTAFDYLMNLKEEVRRHEESDPGKWGDVDDIVDEEGGELQFYQTADDEPWGLWVHDHIDPNLLLSEVNAYNVRNGFKMVSTDEIEHVYAFSDESNHEGELFTMGIVSKDHPNAFKITWVSADNLISVDDLTTNHHTKLIR